MIRFAYFMQPFSLFPVNRITGQILPLARIFIQTVILLLPIFVKHVLFCFRNHRPADKTVAVGTGILGEHRMPVCASPWL